MNVESRNCKTWFGDHVHEACNKCWCPMFELAKLCKFDDSEMSRPNLIDNIKPIFLFVCSLHQTLTSGGESKK